MMLNTERKWSTLNEVIDKEIRPEKDQKYDFSGGSDDL